MTAGEVGIEGGATVTIALTRGRRPGRARYRGDGAGEGSIRTIPGLADR